MANFRLVKIQATVETPATLLLDGQLDEALARLRETLHQCGLNVLSVSSSLQVASIGVLVIAALVIDSTIAALGRPSGSRA